MEIAFIGGVGTVTGSKYLVSSENSRVLIDCGLFQGYKQLRLRNWRPPPIVPDTLSAVILTHAHLDHTGYLPLLVRNGFKGKVYCTRATRELCAILLPDSGRIQEEEAAYANRHGFSKHRPALPLYTEADAVAALERLAPVEFEREVRIDDNTGFRLTPAGHILGAACVQLRNADTSIVFSGDLGRLQDPLMQPPTPIARADYLVVESTYGNRRHDSADPKKRLAEIINRTAGRGGAVILPAFAVGRAQQLLYYVHLLKAARAIPDIPVFLNSPMATDVTRIFRHHRGEHRLTPEQCDALCTVARIINTVADSKWLNTQRGPMIIIAASGMATGGRVLHHIETFAPDPRNTILFAGFQAGGTRGAAMVNDAKAVKIHGQYVPIHAEVVRLDNLSAHADASEILAWLRHFTVPPRATFVTHGELAAADALRHQIEEQLGWTALVPEYLEKLKL